MAAHSDEKLTRHIEYCTKLMHRCSYHLNDVQIVVNTRWKERLETKFYFLLDIEMKRHMEIVDALTGAYGKYRGTHYLESVYKVWYGGLSAYIKQSATTMTPYIRADTKRDIVICDALHRTELNQQTLSLQQQTVASRCLPRFSFFFALNT
ncbi:hypothetical protein QR680_000538 [Steinernema hermaphroditum]|uniref:Uncharacterized protein n=1 Tax=Steinernema hermaphroditum TaxID=289476 RepID=A0AA39LDR6_9BILA|nr:hypothetical protein QR680_000538 [Steinernema hermaphroditum]